MAQKKRSDSPQAVKAIVKEQIKYGGDFKVVMYQLASLTQQPPGFIVESGLQCLGKVTMKVVNR